MDKKPLDDIQPRCTRFPEWHGLPKYHKQNLPLRPVVAACDGPTTGISVILERILQQLVGSVPAHLANTTEDVVGLYPSIPIQEGVDAVMEELENHLEQIDTFGLSLNEVRNLLQFVLSHNYFKFGHQVYHRIDGVAMGNNLAPPFAIIFMYTIETRLLRTAEIKPLVYKRYIDDILILWTYGRERLLQFVQLFNSYHRSIKFTYELSEVSGSVNYMDLTIAIKESGELAYKLFQKPNHQGYKN